MKLDISKNEKPFEVKIIAFLLIALLLLDRNFSKLAIVGPIFLHDALLLFATIFALYKVPNKFKFPSIFLLLVISFLYFLYSIVFAGIDERYLLMVFRHFFLFFYLICCYIIANKIFLNKENINEAISFIVKIAKWSIVLQLGYFIYLFITVPNYSPLKGFSYFSAVGVMGIITYGAYALVYFNRVKRFIIFTFALVISAMLGHSSSFFALFAVYLVHFYISFTPKQRLIGLLSVILILTVVIFKLPQFNDGNANWRLLFWGEILNDAIFNKFLIFGNGFGEPFVSLDFAKEVVSEIGSYNLLGNNNPMVRWEVPPHNSFLTIIFHIGLLPSLLLLLPLKSAFLQIFVKVKSNDKKYLFLFYSLIGSVIWASFNVILELPHSAIYFWLIYFTYIFYNAKKT